MDSVVSALRGFFFRAGFWGVWGRVLGRGGMEVGVGWVRRCKWVRWSGLEWNWCERGGWRGEGDTGI